MVGEFSYLDNVMVPKYSPYVIERSLSVNTTVIEDAFDGNCIVVEGSNGTIYYVSHNGIESTNCTCQSTRNCYHMALADMKLRGEL